MYSGIIDESRYGTVICSYRSSCISLLLYVNVHRGEISGEHWPVKELQMNSLHKYNERTSLFHLTLK